MATLRLEDHVFRVAENQLRLFRFLEEQTSRGFDWGADLSAETLTFTESETGRTLLTCPIRLLGTRSDASGTWLWGWANPGVPPRSPLVAGFDALRAHARTQRRPEFDSARELQLADDEAAMELAIASTGYLGLFTYYTGDYEGGAAFLAITRCPEAESITLDPVARVNLIAQIIETLSFEHRPAIRSYLGKPVRTEGNVCTYTFGDAFLHVQYDAASRIAELSVTVGEGEEEEDNEEKESL